MLVGALCLYRRTERCFWAFNPIPIRSVFTLQRRNAYQRSSQSTFLIKSLHSPVERERRLNSKFDRPYELLESIIRKREGQRVDPSVCPLYILLYIYIVLLTNFCTGIKLYCNYCTVAMVRVGTKQDGK